MVPQIFKVVSNDPDASRLPAGLTSRQSTLRSCPRQTFMASTAF